MFFACACVSLCDESVRSFIIQWLKRLSLERTSARVIEKWSKKAILCVQVLIQHKSSSENSWKGIYHELLPSESCIMQRASTTLTLIIKASGSETCRPKLVSQINISILILLDIITHYRCMSCLCVCVLNA